MGFLTGLFGGHAEAGPYHGPVQFQQNLALQVRMTPQTLEQLRKHGVSDDSMLRLEYFFYTDDKDKAAALHRALAKLGYEGKFERSASTDSAFVITGWTTPVRMDEESAVSWTIQMCKLGYEYDAEFDGWGTNPKQ